MVLPPLPDAASRATTAPAGAPGSGRHEEDTPLRACTAPSPPTMEKPHSHRPVTGASQLQPSPPGTAKSSAYNRSCSGNNVMQMVHLYWAPVEEAVRSRHP